MSRSIVWIRKPLTLRVHKEQLQLHGGDDGILNEGALDGALDRPRTVVGYVPSMSLEELAASGRGTRVTLEHRGWAAIRGDHPVRHGKATRAFLADLGMWWTAQLRSLGERATARRP